jgi:dimethylamine/trimethylamine dehydrogenase
VHLAEATTDLGGRVTRESKLPGLSEWARVRDWRVGPLERMANVSIYRESKLEPEHVLEFGARHVAIATGSLWRRDGVGRDSGFPIFDDPVVYTPDDIMSGRDPDAGPIIIWDDDHYYMGGVLAERSRYAGAEVVLVTTAATVSAWTVNTLEALPIARRMAKLGVEVMPYMSVTAYRDGVVRVASVLTGEIFERPAGALITVTARMPVDALYEGLRNRWQETGIASVTRIGDCWAPSTIQQAVYSGHKWVRELDEEPEGLIPRELPMIDPGGLKAII